MGFRLSVRLTSLPFFLLLSLLMAGCMPQSNSGGEAPPRPQTSEKPYTGTPTSYGGSTTLVTATATFSRYEDGPTGLSTLTTSNPIRLAEFHIFDAAGNRIQQGETGSSGEISAVIPQTAGTYLLSVNSRADNSSYRVSVLDNPYDQNYYSQKATFTVAGGQGSLAVALDSAPAGNTSSLEGGAFNILDQIYVANEFLRAKANDSTNCSVCSLDFVAAPKVPVYWTKGLTPGTYYSSPSTPISFFVANQSGSIYRGLYILGGVQGSVCTDTDHFDRSVILHEYGHFLENAYGKTASPGGSHNGNQVIDPRLAWSEGWANFFQAMALGRSVYRDTVRNSGCAGGNALAFPDFNMEDKATRDVPNANEGIFREISVSRMLYDSATGPALGSAYNLNNDSDSYYGNVGFGIVWHSFKAMANSMFKFQNAGIFNQLLAGYLTAHFSGTQVTNHVNLTTYERQPRDQTLFGQKLSVTPGGACAWSFAAGTPEPDEITKNVVTYSHYLNNNGFFRYDYDGNPANAVIELRYNNSGNTSNAYDLDLFVYREGYTFLDGGDLAKYSTVGFPEAPTSNPNGREVVDLTGQPAGVYMINVKVDYSATRMTTNYYLNVGNSGARLCP